MYQEAFIPAVWTYMGNKSTAAYIRILTTVRDSIFSATGRAWMPEVVIIDHEAAVLAALRYAFPVMYFLLNIQRALMKEIGVWIFTCYFHVLQAAQRKLESLSKGGSKIHNNMLLDSFRRAITSESKVQ